jgi:uncharacterized protein YqeY
MYVSEPDISLMRRRSGGKGSQQNDRFAQGQGHGGTEGRMRGGDKVRLATLRLISAAFKDREIQNRGTGKDESLSEAGMQDILVRMIKQRRESAETYEKGGRPELAAAEKAEITIIEEFLPRQLSIAEMEAAVSGVVKELDASG